MNKEQKRKEILEAMNWRYATKVFDFSKKVEQEDVYTILESGRLSPSALGLEPWKFLVIQNPEIRAKLGKQPKMTEASHLIVITYRTDIENIIQERLERSAKIQKQEVSELGKYKQFLEEAVEPKIKNNTLESWLSCQAYIPLGIMMETASLLGVDNGPMEGFEPDHVDELLGLKEKNLKSVTMLALGHRGEDPASTRPKVRREFEDVVEFV